MMMTRGMGDTPAPAIGLAPGATCYPQGQIFIQAPRLPDGSLMPACATQPTFHTTVIEPVGGCSFFQQRQMKDVNNPQITCAITGGSLFMAPANLIGYAGDGSGWDWGPLGFSAAVWAVVAYLVLKGK